MWRCALSLVLVVQLLLTQMLACHCHAGGNASCGGSVPHIHLPSWAFPAGRHAHESGDDADAGGECEPEDGSSPEDDSGVHLLPTGWEAGRPPVRLGGGTFVLAYVPADRPDLSRHLSVAGHPSGIPPDPGRPGLPTYLRTLHLLV